MYITFSILVEKMSISNSNKKTRNISVESLCFDFKVVIFQDNGMPEVVYVISYLLVNICINILHSGNITQAHNIKGEHI